MVGKHDQDTDISILDSKDSIFHYTREDLAFEYILNKASLKLSSFEKSNDPYECNEKYMGIVGCNQDEYNKVAKILEEIENKILKNSGFLSFCLNEFSPKNDIISSGYLKSRMWSQYGNNHRGVCLVFSQKELVKDFNSNFNEDSYLSDHYEIKYEEFNSITESYSIDRDDIDLSLKNTNMIVLDAITRNEKKIFFRKQKDYRDESEYRFIAIAKYSGDFNKTSIDISNSLKAVIFGDKTPEIYFSLVKDLKKRFNSNIRFFIIKWFYGDFFVSELF